MALVLPNSIFFHAGRTAGHYVRHVIHQMKIPAYEIGQFHDWPSNIKLDDLDSPRLYFCFVRHPLDWLRSYWCHEMQFGWSQNVYAEKLKSDSFAEFLYNAVENYPDGPVLEAFYPFISQCQEVGRQEDLESNLLKILTKAKENVTPSVLKDIGLISVEIDPEIRKSATAPMALLEKVLEVERNFCQRFGYKGIPPDMIGPKQICLAPYVNFGISKKLTFKDASFVTGNVNAFVLNDICVPGIQETRITTMLIKRVLEGLELKNKEVIDVSCTDGVFGFYAEAKGASRVVGAALGMPVATISNLKNVLDSQVEFYNMGLYGVENSISGKFDITFCFRMLELLRYPFLAIRTLSRLMKEGGTLVLECGYLNTFDGVPVMYLPVGSESPMLSRECTFFNKESLMNALASYGFHNFKIHNEFTHGFDKSRDFSQINIAKDKIFHDSDSVVGRLLLSCQWSYSQVGQDTRYLKDGISGQLLSDYWDSQLPSTACIPEYQPTADTLAHLRNEIISINASFTRLQQDLIVAKSAIGDREKDLFDTRGILVERTAVLNQASKDLAERTAELVVNRQTLAERTALFEQNSKDLAERTAELVANRQTLAERTALFEQAGKDLTKRNDELDQIK